MVLEELSMIWQSAKKKTQCIYNLNETCLPTDQSETKPDNKDGRFFHQLLEITKNACPILLIINGHRSKTSLATAELAAK